ncbi:LCP family protein [Candidatus Saccharibacteria bacterium]|nr:LCP family protein [Candidatus Saccharibacteria bacterium]
MSSRSVDGLQWRSGSKTNKKVVSKSQAGLTRRNIDTTKKVSHSTIEGVRKTEGQTKVAEGSRIASVRRSSPIERDEHRQLEIQQQKELHASEQEKANRKRLVMERITQAELEEQASSRRELGVQEKKRGKKAPKLSRSKKKAEDDALQREDEFDFGDEAARKFLAETHDKNAMDFDEIPAKEKKKSWRKQQKAAKKAAKRDAKNFGKKKHKKWPIVLLIIILLLGGGGYFLYNYINSRYQKVAGDDSSILGLLFADEKTPLLADEKGRTNILIFGTEGYSMVDPEYDGGFLTDSMILVSINQDSGDIKAISLPRDLHYTRGACTGTAKLNEIFYCNYIQNDGSEESMKEYEKQGQDALASAFEDILGIEIQYKVHANWGAVLQVVDALGGLDVVFTYGEETWDGPETAIEVTDPRGLMETDGYTTYFSYPTMQVIHLNGTEALGVARSRNSHGGYGAARGNFSREYFQQRIIEATVKKARETNFVTDLGAATGLLNAVGDNIRTTFKDSDIKTLMRLAKELNINNMETLSTVDNYDGRAALMTTGMVNNISYVLPYGGDMYFGNIHSFIQERLYAEGFSREMAQIVVLNGTETPGTAANEQVDLEDEGFSIQSIGNAPDDLQNNEKTVVYQLNDTKPETAAKLAEKYGVELVSDIPESLSEYKGSSDDSETEVTDFIVIIGNDHFAAAN